MPGYVAPPPGLTPPDYSIWSMPPQEAPPPQGLPESLLYCPPVGRAAQMRAALDRQAQVPQAPEMVPPLCQPLPSSRGWPATPYQQAVQPPSIWGWESPSTPPLTNMQPRADRMPMVTGGRELEAEMITPSLPVTPGECTRGPPLGRPANRRLARWVSAPPEHLSMFPQLQNLKVPRLNVAVVRGPHLKTL